MILCFRMERTLRWRPYCLRHPVWFHQTGQNTEHHKQPDTTEQRGARHHVPCRRQREDWCWRNISAAATIQMTGGLGLTGIPVFTQTNSAYVLISQQQTRYLTYVFARFPVQWIFGTWLFWEDVNIHTEKATNIWSWSSKWVQQKWQ